jgi:hypothetical protein
MAKSDEQVKLFAAEGDKEYLAGRSEISLSKDIINYFRKLETGW